MTAIQRFALHGTIMNPHSHGPYVRHEDHLAAMQGRCLAKIEEPAPATFMTKDRALEWAWDKVREEVGTKGWTTGDSCNFYGFFLYGWNYRGQYDLQRSTAIAAIKQELMTAAPALEAPAAPARIVADALIRLEAIYREHAEADCDELPRRPDWLTTALHLAAAAPQAPAAPADPMDWPLPCDVTVGHGTIRKGCKLRTLVLRMQVLYDLSQKVELAAPAAPAVDAETVKKAARYDWLRGSNVANGTVLAEHFGGSRMQDFDTVIDAKIAARAAQAKEGGAAC